MTTSTTARVAVITGASSGIGVATAGALAENGYSVAWVAEVGFRTAGAYEGPQLTGATT